MKKRLTEMRMERDKLKHPEWFKDKRNDESVAASPRKAES